MKIRTGQKVTKIGTNLPFTVYDFRGTNGFPHGQCGFVFEYLEKRIIACKYSGQPIKRDARYLIRTDETSFWRIDMVPKFGPTEAVYGVDQDRLSHWKTAADAARALVGVLDEIQHNSSLGGSI